MFRQSRDPSTTSSRLGRPPTPPMKQQKISMGNSSPYFSSNSSPASGSSKLPSGKKKPFNGYSRSKVNSTILNFFQKTGTTTADKTGEDLFFREKGGKNVKSREISPVEERERSLSPSRVFLDEVEGHGTEDINQDEPALKRRKLSDDGHSPSTSGPAYTPPPPERKLSLLDKDEPVAQVEVASEAKSIQKAKTKPKKRIGGFIDDSDSDDDSPPVRFDMDEPSTVADDHQNEQWKDTKISKMPSTANDGVQNILDGLDQDGYDTTIAPIQSSTNPLLNLSNPSDNTPALLRQSTSVGDAWDFEEDFDEDEFYEQGEEYLERRWMQEQQALETGFGDEDADDNVEDITPNLEENTEIACPICGGSLAGISDTEASRHVNSCLDGNPIPIPKLAPSSEKAHQKQPETSIPTPKRFQRAAIARPAQQSPFSLGNESKGTSAFAKLMSGHAEDAAWATAAANEVKSRGRPAWDRTCPFYKILPGFFICVDGFRYGKVEGCNAYFLSHFHSDHYIGMTSSWCHGPIYCSRVTANLILQQLKVDPKWIRPLDWEQTVEVPETNGVFVTMIPANHCPGSSLFMFEKTVGKGNNPRKQRVLHCGDFRACPAHVNHPLLRPDVLDAITGKTKQQMIDVCYLDTTYLTPKYSFPCQEDVIESCAQMCVSLSKEIVDVGDAWEHVKRERAGQGMVKFLTKEPNTDVDAEVKPEIVDDVEDIQSKTRGRLLVVIGTYSIGKERICVGIARALKSKIYAVPSKQRICAALEDPELSSLLTSNPMEAQVHMQMLMEIRAETLADYLQSFKPHFTRVVGFRPSGWNYRPPNSRFTENPAVSTVLNSDGWKSRFTMKDLVPQRGSTRESNCFGVPYSEHSSFRELTLFCCALRIGKVIPTVNVGSKTSRERMKMWVEKWEAEKKKNGLFKIEDGATRW